jgi:hypothetical protein
MYDPNEPFNNFPLPPYNSGDANPEETLRGCLITSLMFLLGFVTPLVIAYFISKLF